MPLNQAIYAEAFALTQADANIVRDAVAEAVLEERFVAEFVAESEALEGYESRACDVLNSVRDLVGLP